MDFNFFKNLIQSELIGLHTAFIGVVKSVNESRAEVTPLTYSKDAQGNLLKQAVITAVVPPNVKYTTKDITYVTNASYASYSVNTTKETTTVLVPEALAVGDVVLCVVCERDITYAVQGKLHEPSNRRHDMNDSVIAKVL